MIESTIGVLHNIVCNQKPRKYPKTPEQKAGTPTSGFMTSLLVTLIGHVTSSSHVGHAQGYILYYYHSKKKTRENTHFRSYDITSGHFRYFRSCAMVRPPEMWLEPYRYTTDPRHIFLIRVSNSLKFEVSGNLCSLFMEVFTHFARNFKTGSFIILHRINSNSCLYKCSVPFDVFSGDFFTVCIYIEGIIFLFLISLRNQFYIKIN